MNEIPPDQGEADELDELYRRASAADPSRPSDSVRRAVLEHAAQLAEQRSLKTGPVNIDITRPAANQAWRRPAIFGTLAAAALAGLMIAPQFFSPGVTDRPASPPTVNAQQESAGAPTAQDSNAAPQAPAEAPPLQSNDQVAEMKADKRAPSPQGEAADHLQPRASTPIAGRYAAAVPRSRAGNGSVDGQSLANGTSRQASSAAGASSAANAPTVANAPGSGNASTAADALASGSVTAGVDARRMQSITSSMNALSARRPQTAAPMASPAPAAPAAPAAWPADPASELRRAAEIGDLPALQALLDAEPSIDARDEGGRTALMLATQHGQNRAVDLLLAAGADPNVADARGTTPLQAALAGNQSAIAAALRRAGAR
jgi:Ankyrin repeats (3 copies)